MNPLAIDDGIPTELEQTVSLIAKSAQLQEVGVTKALSVRMPAMLFASLKAIADHSGLSINRVAVQLMRVGLDAVSEALPQDDAIAIAERRSVILHDLLKGQDFEQSEEV